MSLHRLSAGAGYTYLLRHTACGDVQRAAATPLTAYYTEAGYPPGRWYGAGLSGLADGRGLATGSIVTEQQMGALYGAGRDPVTGVGLGKAYPTFAPLAERIARKVATLPHDLDPQQRKDQTAAIQTREGNRPSPCAVAGFDLTFTIPKSASVLWALADPKTQAAIAESHRAAVDDVLAFLEARALFTRTGSAGCAQVPTQGMLATSFDHWDTRTGDPNLHTHVVIANKVQGPDGAWRSLDSRALHHAAVAVSEMYDDLLADHLAVRLPVKWGWRSRGERRTPAFELDGIDDQLLSEFSTRSVQVDAAMRDRLVEFHATHSRGPTRIEVLQLRQQATRATRPAKSAHPLSELLVKWREQAQRLTGHAPQVIADGTLQVSTRPLRVDQISPDLVLRLADETLENVMVRRSTWTPWNVLTEAARTTRGIRMVSSADRRALIDSVTAAVLDASTPLDPPELVEMPQEYRRADGTSVFTRPGEHRYSYPRLLDAEQRLLDANLASGAAQVPKHVAQRLATTPQHATRTGNAVKLADDQVAAVIAVATSGRHLDVLVGPAGTGKTTTLRALRAAWETTHGRGSVLGLAPSATAAHELSAALDINCENTAKWLYETTGPGGLQRIAVLAGLKQRQATTTDLPAVRRIEAARANLGREQQRWTLRPGQLLVVDEASLAGTLALDNLRQQAMTAGAKLLLVGDHRQLTSVDAGGAFGLLAEQGRSLELRSLWRFRNRWEAGATRRLRHGDPDVLDDYEQRGRLQAGPAEAMLEAAYQGWQASEQAGQAAVLVASDTHTVEALNTRAHEDRVIAGLVSPDRVPLGSEGERGQVGVGDRVVTRRNNRGLAVPGHGHVRNGSLWTVVATSPDGSLTVSPADRHVTHGCEPDPASTVKLPAAYVAAYVDLGYATTAHRAQGLTVDACHTLVGPGMSREALYVAMTRGRDANIAYVATDAVDPACDQLPDVHAARTGRQILDQVLATSSAELSATQTLVQRQDVARSLKTLTPIRETLVAEVDVRRWQPLLVDCGLTDDQAERLLDSPARGALFAALREGENLGHPMPRVLAGLVAARPLDAPDDPTRDVAAVLHERVDRWLEIAPEPPQSAPPSAAASLLLADRAYASADESDPVVDTLAQIDALIAQRIDALTDSATATRPSWLRPLEGDPSTGAGSTGQRERIAVVVAYRDLTGTDSPSPLGPDRTTDRIGGRRRRIAGHAASTAERTTVRQDERSPSL
jgi:conjugative relaxase-like TrwC/TraI family protein